MTRDIVLRAIASTLGVPTDVDRWPSDVARAVCKLANSTARLEHSNREALRAIAAATRGKDLDDVPACLETTAERLIVEVKRMYADRQLHGQLCEGQLCEGAARRAVELGREIEELRGELTALKEGK